MGLEYNYTVKVTDGSGNVVYSCRFIRLDIASRDFARRVVEHDGTGNVVSLRNRWNGSGQAVKA